MKSLCALSRLHILAIKDAYNYFAYMCMHRHREAHEHTTYAHATARTNTEMHTHTRTHRDAKDTRVQARAKWIVDKKYKTTFVLVTLFRERFV